MAALAGDTPNAYSNVGIRDTQPYVIAQGAQCYVGSLCDQKTTAGEVQPHIATGGTASPIIGIAIEGGVPGSNPYLDGFALTNGMGPGAGPLIAPGNVTTAAAGNANKVVLETGRLIVKSVTLAVAGTLTGAITDVGMKLYCPTDNIADSATTATNSDLGLGHVQKFNSYNAAAATANYDIQVMDYVTRRGY